MNQRTRIKICGLTRIEDANHVALQGADSIGLVFHKNSPRYIDMPNAMNIRQSMPPFVTVTALFLDEDSAWVDQVIDNIDPDCIQFHGEETPAYCSRWSKPYIKSIPMGSTKDVVGYARRYHKSQGFLLDSNVAGKMGGSGGSFDWSEIPSKVGFPVILAGGLTPQNVAEAVGQVQPWGVDVSSGVEISKGIKDLALIKLFFDEVNRADRDVPSITDTKKSFK